MNAMSKNRIRQQSIGKLIPRKLIFILRSIAHHIHSAAIAVAVSHNLLRVLGVRVWWYTRQMVYTHQSIYTRYIIASNSTFIC